MEDKKNIISNDSSSRIVYDLFNGSVLKKPKNERGNMECYNEWSIFENSPDWVKESLCPVINYDVDKGYLTMKKIKPFSLKKDITDILKEKEDMINFLINNYDIDEFDLSYPFNWGIDEKGQILLLDYGHTFCDDYCC